MIKTVFIDIDNTLLDFDKCAEQSMKENFYAHGLPYSPDFINTFLETNNLLWHSLERGDISLDELHEIRWNLIFAKLDIMADGVDFEKGFCTLLAKSTVPVDGAMEILDYLSSKYVLCAASNGPYGQQCYRLEKAGMSKYFYKLFVSESAGSNKPSKAFFDFCFKNLPNSDVNSSLLIGDSPTADIAGGIAYGLKTIWFNHDKLPIDAAKGCDFSVNFLSEIKNIL